MGLTLKEHAEVCMALAESSASAGLCYMMSNVAVNCLNLFGSYQLKQKIFSDIVQNKTFAALAYSELGHGYSLLFEFLHQHGLEFGQDYVEKRFDVGVGLHGDHVGGELNSANAFTETLFKMDYNNPEHKEMMDLEGLKRWIARRKSLKLPSTRANIKISDKKIAPLRGNLINALKLLIALNND